MLELEREDSVGSQNSVANTIASVNKGNKFKGLKLNKQKQVLIVKI